MKIVKWTEILLLASSLAVGVVWGTYATADSVKETVKEAGQDTAKGAKKMARKVKDETCELVNGKMECVGKKVKHGVQNTSDEVKDKIEDIKK